jgi:hypothetical protein
MTSSAEDRARSQPGRKQYQSLRQRLVVANAVLLLAACILTALILAPRKFSSPELDEAAILGAPDVSVGRVTV